MTYEEFVQEEKAIEANHAEFFTGGKKLSDFILIVFNMRSGYKRHEWINEKGLDEEVKTDLTAFLERLEESKEQV
ncbi:MAG: hypothetical protein EPN85_04810 [Bacteroidetes bacterium]|nr:MAG: hypothetical protein EPN85_04810 [Bacteroidota bacterium]